MTDTERREVARRLRMSRSEWSGMGWRLWLGPKFGAVVLSDGNRDELEDAAHRLADLIEPSDSAQTVAEDMFGQMRHSTEQERIAYADMMARNSVELHPVDRDALLRLADEIDRKSNDGTTNPDPMRPLATSLDLFGYARRIREACGEVVG